MGYLREICLRNFQKHKDFRLLFDPGVNTIVGPTDIGKSSVVRAIRWVVFNRPLGDFFITRGEKFCSVSLYFLGEGEVVREKGEGINRYVLSSNGDKLILDSVGTDVPIKVRNFLRMGDVNFSLQHDPPFLFGLSGGELTRRLDDYFGLSEIEGIVNEVIRRERQVSSELSVLDTELEEVEGSISRLVWVREALSFLEGLERDIEEKSILEKEWIEISNILGDIGEFERRLRDVNECLSFYEEMGEFEELLKLKDVYCRISDLVKEIEGYYSLGLEEVFDLVCWIESRVEEVMSNREKFSVLCSIVKEFLQLEEEERSLSIELKRLREELKVCPLCGSRFE